MASILITGGTGSLGHELVRQLLSADNAPERLVIYSRDEQKQQQMRAEFGDHYRLRFFLGDVRDQDRLRRAMNRIDTVIHAAALKIVPSLEYDPIEALKTNAVGTANVINACIDAGVGRAILASTDKAVNPINLYGATKLCAEKLFVAANNLSGSVGGPGTKFSVCRYGNVTNSRGSVIPLWKALAEQGRPLVVTDVGCTRFWITLNQAADLILSMLEHMNGGEIFVPRLPAFRIIDLATAITGDIEIVGLRPGEKLHETLISGDESWSTTLKGDLFTIHPPWWNVVDPEVDWCGKDYHQTGLMFRYASDLAQPHMTVEELREAIQ